MQHWFQVPRRLATYIIGALILVALLVVAGYVSSTKYPELNELAAHPDWTYLEVSEYFERLADDKGAMYAFDILLYAELPAGINAHLIGHLIGTALYEQKGIEAMQLCTQDFRNACAHSVAIGIFRDYGEGGLDTIADVCRAAPGGEGAYTMCFHGLGHGILAYTGYNLEQAVELCKKTGTPAYDNGEFIECIGGAIMELDSGFHNVPAWQAMAPLYYSKEDVLAPCSNWIPGIARPMCYTYLTPHLFRRANVDTTNIENISFADAFAFCELAPQGEERTACYGGFGKEFVGLAKAHDVRDVGSMDDESLLRVRAWCAQATTQEAESACHEQALAALYWGGENNPDASFKYCALAGTGEEQNTCYSELTKRIVYFTTSGAERLLLCSRLPDPHQAVCKEARTL